MPPLLESLDVLHTMGRIDLIKAPFPMEWNSISSQLNSQPQDSDAGYRDYCIEAEKEDL